MPSQTSSCSQMSLRRNKKPRGETRTHACDTKWYGLIEEYQTKNRHDQTGELRHIQTGMSHGAPAIRGRPADGRCCERCKAPQLCASSSGVDAHTYSWEVCVGPVWMCRDQPRSTSDIATIASERRIQLARCAHVPVGTAPSRAGRGNKCGCIRISWLAPARRLDLHRG